MQAFILITMKPMLENSIKASNMDSILVFGGVMLVLIFLHGSCAILVSRMSAKVSADMAEKTRSKMFRRVLMTDELDPSSDTSGMMIRLMNDIDSVQRMVTDFLRVWLYTFFLTLGLIAVAFTLDTRMGFVFLASTVIVYLIIIRTARIEYRYRSEIITKLETMIRAFRSYIRGARKRRYLGCIDTDQKRFNDLSGDYSRSCDDTRIRAYRRSSLSRLLFTGSICGIVILYFLFEEEAVLSYATVMVFIQLAVLLEASLTLYPFLIESIPIASASIDKINEITKYGMKKRDMVPETTDSEYIIRSNSGKYPSIRRGEETSIITMADAGPWDFVQIVMGTRNADKDTLYFEEKDISDINHSYLTKRIAYAGPKALTMDRTIRENIDVWRGIDNGRIEEVCKALSIDKPLDFEVQRSGTNISAGEAYKISIARAMVSDADVYIFDNTFILLDHQVKRSIIQYIRSSLKGRTVILISSNGSISAGSDNIVMISEGKVVCNDTGANVKDSNDLYKELCRARRCSVEGE